MAPKKEASKIPHARKALWERIDHALTILIDNVFIIAYLLMAYGLQVVVEHFQIAGIEKSGMHAMQGVLIACGLVRPVKWFLIEVGILSDRGGRHDKKK